ncbi:DUF4331 family protein [Ekhidna sp. To15]|uniref:DUF4331 family protein n=1 Tax=Ekhidna sp. To15 TaxID=3395267 RepID=UPI003F51D053
MRKLVLSLGLVISAALVIVLVAADHIDAPAVGSLSSGSTVEDITDYYAFESPSNSDNYVFVCNVAGLSSATSFSDDVMYEFNIDSDGDNVEDQLIQVYFEDDQAITYGVVDADGQTGLNSQIVAGATRVSADISSPVTSGSIQLFAGLRDDPFFMDFFQFVDIVNGVGASLSDDTNTGVYDANRDSDPDMDGVQPYPAAFKADGEATDTFAGANVLSVVVEVPKSSINDTDGKFTSWVEAKVKQ